MAASNVIPARTSVRPDRATIARTAARTAPRGPGLAPVVALPLQDDRIRDDRVGRGRPAPVLAPLAPAPASHASAEPTGAQRLRLVAPPRRQGLRPRRRAVVVCVTVLVAVTLLGAVRGVLAQPEVAIAAGHVVLAPGETLWDVAVRSAPAGVDPRDQLDAIRRLNGFGSTALDAWTVVLIPAR